ncbi:glucan endo-1,3-beta-glucosidase 6-like [Impatiens glandulifera]|uniref:glucan endo-1,3-beta-glucosidase 6-like n=1 Tax=Impatiens glandulifera TaxID=253017 RepID=UPI001FB10DAC|nr:glucan endo-1,3-beta-glucosidase 6-like [Impatiens glandulifera]
MGLLLLLISMMMMISFVNGGAGGIGANWGTQASHPLPATMIVKLLKDNGIKKVKVFDADWGTLNALSGSEIEVMAGIPNDMLSLLAGNATAAQLWVDTNVSFHITTNDVKIRYVAVGNEPFLSTYNGTYLTTTLPALQNIQTALIKSGFGNLVKVTVPLNADVYESSTSLPSTGDFRADIHDLMIQILEFLKENNSPFTVNIYPFISLYKDPNFPLDYAFFNGYSSPINDNGRIYQNVFDANLDTLFWALQKNGYETMSVIVGEVGWPTDGDGYANPNYAQKFNQGLISHIGVGTPLRPGPIEAYLFSLIDEDAKSIQPGNFERHWGMFNYDGTPKYHLNLMGSNDGELVGASGVHYLAKKWCVLSSSVRLDDDSQFGDSLSYACSHADCTSLGYGTSCGGLDARGNISYAFNSYYQQNDQVGIACRFPNLSVVTTVDPSVGSCKFKVMVRTTVNLGRGRSLEGPGFFMILWVLLVFHICF